AENSGWHTALVARSPLLVQQPGNDVRVAVGLVPGIVADAGVFGVLDVRVAGGLDRLHHLAGALDRDGGVGIAMEDPDRERFERRSHRRGIPTPADRNDG